MGVLRILHGLLAQPVVALGFSGLSLLLLVLVLLSVPGPIKGLSWFRVASPVTDGAELITGLQGWCWSGTSNCTYAAISDNEYLASMFDVSSALTVKTLVPLSCYWALVTVVAWGVVVVTAPSGYRIVGAEHISRHLYFNIIEVSVLCMQLFSCLLTWMAFGFTNKTYRDVDKAANLKSGRAMETIAVSALFSMGSFFVACYGLYLRIEDTSSEWKEEIACLIFNASAAGGTNTGIIRTAPSAQGNAKGRGKGIFGQFGASRTSVDEDWDWDRGSLNRGVTIFSRPSSRNSRPPSRNNGKREAEKFEIPTEDRMESIPVDGDDGCHAVTITQDADLETGVTYTVLNRNRSLTHTEPHNGLTVPVPNPRPAGGFAQYKHD